MLKTEPWIFFFLLLWKNSNNVRFSLNNIHFFNTSRLTIRKQFTFHDTTQLSCWQTNYLNAYGSIWAMCCNALLPTESLRFAKPFFQMATTLLNFTWDTGRSVSLYQPLIIRPVKSTCVEDPDCPPPFPSCFPVPPGSIHSPFPKTNIHDRRFPSAWPSPWSCN